MKTVLLSMAFVAGLLIATAESSAQTVKRVRFANGASSATVKGTIRGLGYIDYLVNIRAGQVLTLKLSGSRSAELVIFDPDGENVPDAAGIREMVSQIDVGGDYKVRVLMPRALGRRKSAAAGFSLFVKITNMR